MSSSVQTRTLMREREGKREFFEVSWTGLEAEVATGNVGSPARVKEFLFESDDELREFIAEEIERARREGFTEAAPPEGEGRVSDEDPDADLPQVDMPPPSLRREAFLPVWSQEKDHPKATKFGGVPFLLRGEAWPTCGRCEQPLHFLAQLRHDELPPPVQGRLKPGLLQLFWCDRDCQAEAGGEPFARSTWVRTVDPSQPGGAPEDVPRGVTFGAKRVAGWSAREEYPLFDDLADACADDSEYDRYAAGIEEREAGPVSGEKLGGWPHWLQGSERARCTGCRGTMEPLLQLDSHKALPVQFGDMGIGWLSHCDACGIATFHWQCC